MDPTEQTPLQEKQEKAPVYEHTMFIEDSGPQQRHHKGIRETMHSETVVGAQVKQRVALGPESSFSLSHLRQHPVHGVTRVAEGNNSDAAAAQDGNFAYLAGCAGTIPPWRGVASALWPSSTRAVAEA